VIDDDPDERDAFVNLRLRVEEATRPDGQSIRVSSAVLVRADPFVEFRYGDRIEAAGWLEPPPEFAAFNYRDYLASKGVHAILDRPRVEIVSRGHGSPVLAALFDLKDRAKETIAAILPEPQAALLTGILLGDDNGLPQSVKDDFRVTGTSHIIAISGYNFSVLIALVSVPAVRLFGRRRAFPILLLIVLAYMVFVGASAAVVRAAIMGALVLWATYLGRQAQALNSLFAAAVVMTLLDPLTLGDIGFQLSFAATLGLVLYTRPLQNAVERGLSRLFSAETTKQVVGALSDAVLVTLAAQITTLPILVVVFRQIALHTLVVNALVLPAQVGVMLLGGLALLAGTVVLPLGQVVGWSAWLFLTWTIQVIHLFAQIPGATINLGYVDPLWGALYVAALAALTFYASRSREERTEVKRRMAKLISPRVGLSVLGSVTLLAAVALSWRPDGKLHVHALNVEGGPAFIQTPGGRQILIGGSKSPSALLAALGARMPFWDRDLDLVVVPRLDAESVNGLLAVVDRYAVGRALSIDAPGDRFGREWLDAIAARSIEVVGAGSGVGIEEGLSLMLGEGGWVRIDAGATSVGVGTPSSEPGVDMLILDEVTDKAAAWIKLNRPQIVVTHTPVEPDRLVEGIAFVDAETRSIELVFDAAHWSIYESP